MNVLDSNAAITDRDHAARGHRLRDFRAHPRRRHDRPACASSRPSSTTWRRAASEDRLITGRMGSIGWTCQSYAYRASKARLNAIGRSLAIDLQAPHPGYAAASGGVKTRGGGTRAALEVADSIAAMRKLIARLGSHRPSSSTPWKECRCHRERTPTESRSGSRVAADHGASPPPSSSSALPSAILGCGRGTAHAAGRLGARRGRGLRQALPAHGRHLRPVRQPYPRWPFHTRRQGPTAAAQSGRQAHAARRWPDRLRQERVDSAAQRRSLRHAGNPLAGRDATAFPVR